MKKKKEELQEALKSLERCCPEGTCDTIQLNLSSELREALLNLDRARGREELLKEELMTANEALREAHDNLERRVEERTAELQASNVLLQREIIERRRAEEEKGLLLREIHHRVKNNMQIISSILQLQSGYTKDEQSLATLRESKNRINAMATIHEKLYQSDSLAKINFQEYIEEMIISLLVTYGVNTGTIEREIDAEGIYFDIDTAIPCGLILNELISNCIRHAFPEGKNGHIKSSIRSDSKGEFTLTVSDNGIGFAEDIDFRHSNTLGLHLLNALTEQLDGTIELERNKGTTFRVTFREVEYINRL